jgi:transposase InsO family protein
MGCKKSVNYRGGKYMVREEEMLCNNRTREQRAERDLRAPSQNNPAGVLSVTFRKKFYTSLEMLQSDLDAWLYYYNHERTHQGKMCCGRTLIVTLEDSKEIWKEKMVV